MAEALLLSGKPIDWNHPPAATERVRWSKRDMYGRVVTGSLRTIAHLNRLNMLAKKKYGAEIVVIQPPYNIGVAASQGTHDKDACLDLYIPGVSWWEQQRFFRANGFACWYRHPPLFGNHIHGFTLPIPEGREHSDDFATYVGLYVDGGVSTRGAKVASSQIDDYYNHAFGLAYQHQSGSDRSWFPANINATVFDLDGYIRRRMWKPNDDMAIDLSNTIAVFRIALGLDKGKIGRVNGVGLIQQGLNKVAGEHLAVDGVCGKKTVDAWRRWERRPHVPGTGRPAVPDEKSLGTFAKRVGLKTKP